MEMNTICSISKYCSNNNISFEFPDRQRIICYLNKHIVDKDQRLEIAKVFLKHTEIDWKNILEYFELNMDVSDYKLFYLLKRYGVDVNDFGISMTFNYNSNDEPKSEILNAALPSEVLLEKYANYKLEFIWEPLIFKNGINIFGAERGAGKTRIAICLAYALLYELPEFLGYNIKTFGDVLFLNFEIHEPEFKLFLEPIVRFFENNGGVQKHELRIISFLSHPELKIQAIEELVKDYKPALIIVDSFKAFAARTLADTRTRELTNLNIDNVYKYFNSWKKQQQSTILILNHTNKNTKSLKSHSDLMFGPSAFTDYADHTFLIRKTDVPNQRILIPDKSRFAAEGNAVNSLIEICSDEADNVLWIELIKSDVREDEFSYSGNENRYKEEQRTKVMELYNTGLSIREISKETGIPRSTVGSWIKNNNKSPP